MFKNMRVGTKLLAVALAPLVVLAVLAGLGVRDRLSEADQARAVEDQARLVAADNELVHQLQRERTYSAWYMQAAAQGASEEALAPIRAALDEQRTATDAALEQAGPLLEGDAGDGEGSMSAAMTATSGRLEQLDVVRQSVDANQVDASIALDIYGQTIALVLDLNEQISNVSEDPTLSVPLSDSVSVARLAEAEGQISAILTVGLVSGELTDAQVDQLTELTAAAEAQDAQIRESPDAETKTQLRNQQARPDIADAASLQEQILLAEAGGASLDGVTPEEWVDASMRRLDAYQDVQLGVIGRVIGEASAQAADADDAVRLYVLGALGAILLAILLAVAVGRATTGPLRRLTRAADELSTERLPRLVDDLKAPAGPAPASMALEPIDISSNDEIGQLAGAFNRMQEVTAEVAEEQSALLRKGIGDIFVNLARRNQALLDRQIEFIDGLEANEEDPDQLENLFKLDHLATRMRRNAESLLVLAGAEPPRRRARPVALADVVRVAIGEVEDFTRISLLALDEVTVGGNVAVDLAHLLSELMENATHFSPPDTRVEVVGHRTRDEGYIISVSDQGIGMSAEQLADANQLMAQPPLVGLALSRSLGFIVIGRLAARFGIKVRLTASPSGGVTALVGLPPDLVTDQPVPAATAPLGAGASPAAPTGPAPAPPPTPPTPPGAPLPTRQPGGSPTPGPVPPLPPEVPPAPVPAAPASLDAALPQGPAFEDGLASLLAPGEPPASSPPAPPAPPPELFRDADPAPPVPPAPPASSPPPAPAAPEWLPDEGFRAPVPDGSVPPTPPAGAAPPAPPPVPQAPPAPQGPPPPPPPPPPGGPQPPALPGWMAEPQGNGDAGRTRLTAAGLVQRTPRSARTPGAPAAPTPTDDGTAIAPTQRSPEEVRAMLSRYRSGLQQGRGPAGSPTPGDPSQGSWSEGNRSEGNREGGS